MGLCALWGTAALGTTGPKIGRLLYISRRLAALGKDCAQRCTSGVVEEGDGKEGSQTNIVHETLECPIGR